MSSTVRDIRAALVLLVLFTVLCGAAYPLLITGLARVAAPGRAGGSLVVRDGTVVGSELIAQAFAEPRYFWPRPSGASFNAAVSSGSNTAPSNPALIDAVKERVAALRAADPENREPIPTDLVLASGSGLDPHISPEGALWQVPRVARARGLEPSAVASLVREHIEPRTFGLLGDPRVNVLRLNLALDAAR